MAGVVILMVAPLDLVLSAFPVLAFLICFDVLCPAFSGKSFSLSQIDVTAEQLELPHV